MKYFICSCCKEKFSDSDCEKFDDELYCSDCYFDMTQDNESENYRHDLTPDEYEYFPEEY